MRGATTLFAFVALAALASAQDLFDPTAPVTDAPATPTPPPFLQCRLPERATFSNVNEDGVGFQGALDWVVVGGGSLMSVVDTGAVNVRVVSSTAGVDGLAELELLWIGAAPALFGDDASNETITAPCAQPGRYAVTWDFHERCDTLTLAAVDDACTVRVAQYDALTLRKQASRERRCGFEPSQRYASIYQGAFAPLSVNQVLLSVGNKTDVVESSAVATIATQWSFSDAGTLVVRDTYMEDGDDNYSCFDVNPDYVGLYHVSWDDECVEAQLTLMSDTNCPRRAATYHNMFVHLENVPVDHCTPFEGESFDGHYPPANVDLGGDAVTMTFAEDSPTEQLRVVEVAAEAKREAAWLPFLGNVTDELTGRDIERSLVDVRDVFADPFRFACGPREALYYSDFDLECNALGLRPVYDQCQVRRQLYDTLTVRRELPKCSFVESQTWRGFYVGDERLRSGQPVTMKIGAWGVVAESYTTEDPVDAAGSFDTRFFIQNTTGALVTHQVSSSLERLECDAETQGLYRLQWRDECTVVELVLIEDECAVRRNVYNGLTLHKDPSQCSFFRGEAWQSIGSLGGAGGAAATAQFALTSDTSVSITSATSSEPESTWAINQWGNLEFTHSDCRNCIEPLELQCTDAEQSGRYQLTWSADCATVRMDDIADDCASRSSRYSGVSFTKGFVPPPRTCALHPGDHFVGMLPEQTDVPELVGGRLSIAVTAANAALVEETLSLAPMTGSGGVPPAAVVHRVNWHVDETGDLNVVDALGESRCFAPDDGSELVGDLGAGRYKLVFSDDCSSITLSLPDEFVARPPGCGYDVPYNDASCPSRRAAYNGVTLTKTYPHCKLLAGDVWEAYYADASGREVTFTVGDNGRLAEQSQLGYVQSQVEVSDSGNLVTYELQSARSNTVADDEELTCPSRLIAEYSMVWNADCTHLDLHANYDLCARRKARWNGMLLSRRIEHGPKCGFNVGDIYSGYYGFNALPPNGMDVAHLQGTNVSITVRGRTAVLEANNEGWFAAAWFVDDWGRLRTRDVRSQPAEAACDPSFVGSYEVAWNWDCTRAEVSCTFDPCQSRSALYDGMHLQLDHQRCSFDDHERMDVMLASGNSADLYMKQSELVLLETHDYKDHAQVRAAFRWSLDNAGVLHMTTVDATHPDFSCARDDEGTYSLVWMDECSRATMYKIHDDCAARGAHFDGAVLHGHQVRLGDAEHVCPEAEPDIQFNFAGLIPEESKCCAQKPPPPPTPPPPPPAPRRPAFIYGNFLDGLTQEPITPGTVTCTYTTFEPNTVSSDSADRFGAYSIGPLFHAGLGDYTCQCEAPGYLRPSSDDLQVLEGTRERYDCVLIPAPSCVNGQISSSADGRLLPLTTSALCTTNNGQVFSERTDVNATYEFDDVQATGQVNCTGVEECGRYGNIVESGELARGQCTTVDIALPPTVLKVNVEAQVFAPGTPFEPVEGIVLTVVKQGSATCCVDEPLSGVTAIPTTGADTTNAYVTWQPVCSESWLVSATDPTNQLLPTSRTISVTAGVLNEFTLQMELNAPIVEVQVLDGTFVIEGDGPVPFANVRFSFPRPNQNFVWTEGNTGPNVGDARDGFVDPPVRLFLPQTYSLLVSAPNFQTISTEQRITADDIDPACNCIRYILRGVSGVLRGCISDRAGTPLEGVTVSVTDTLNIETFATQDTDDTGCAEWSNVPLSQEQRYLFNPPAENNIVFDPDNTCQLSLPSATVPSLCDRVVQTSNFGDVFSSCIDAITGGPVDCICTMTTAEPPRVSDRASATTGEWELLRVPINSDEVPVHSISCTREDYSTVVRQTAVFAEQQVTISPPFQLQPAIVRMWGFVTARGQPLPSADCQLYAWTEGSSTETPPDDVRLGTATPLGRAVSDANGAIGNPPPHTSANPPAYATGVRTGYWHRCSTRFGLVIEWVSRDGFVRDTNDFDYLYEINLSAA